MNTSTVPDYAEFDDYRHYVRIAVLVRWLVLVVWFVLQNTRVGETGTTFYTNNALAAGLVVLGAPDEGYAAEDHAPVADGDETPSSDVERRLIALKREMGME